MFVFNHFGDLERCALRPGNVHSADGCKEVLDPVVSSAVAVIVVGGSTLSQHILV
jgi:hypothetical protein